MSTADGTWNVSMTTPMGAREITLDLATAGGDLSGTAQALGSTVPLEEGSVDGSALSFVLPIDRPMPMRLKFQLTVDGDGLNGSVSGGPLVGQQVTGTRA